MGGMAAAAGKRPAVEMLKSQAGARHSQALPYRSRKEPDNASALLEGNGVGSSLFGPCGRLAGGA